MGWRNSGAAFDTELVFIQQVRLVACASGLQDLFSWREQGVNFSKYLVLWCEYKSFDQSLSFLDKTWGRPRHYWLVLSE